MLSRYGVFTPTVSLVIHSDLKDYCIIPKYGSYGSYKYFIIYLIAYSGKGRVGRLLHSQDTTLTCLQQSHMSLQLDNGRLLVGSLKLSVKHDRKE